eukprot:CAMPEP_0181049390 /NCGR_PEP_ID=MMETSP1070-20121207/15954_1 /TAXON_ID=265543 /ORGANISM="Minutocellus polymorphus, Strain NH13" /LENGTH=686 /DNA_ID=CAMNT_0023128259 /DNA_START=60 /DNA_END=2120 /DNA_ORIENTATION=+
MRQNLGAYAALTGTFALSVSPPSVLASAGVPLLDGHTKHTTPTMLQVFDEASSSFVDALSNELYDELKGSSARFVMPGGGNGSLRGGELPVTMSARTADADAAGGIRKGEPLTLTWTGNEYDRPIEDDDVIAMYCPAHEVDPRKFRDAATVAQARASTRKHLELHLKYRPDVNEKLNDEAIALTQRRLAGKEDNSWWISSFPIIREPTCEFRYWRRDGNMLQLAGRTGSLPLALSLENPTSIHIALTSEPSEMTVQFTTGAVGKPVVEYGPSNGYGKVSDFPMRADGTSTTYQASDMCQEPANITEPGKFQDPGSLHTVILTGLKPDAEYSYRVGLSYGQGIVWSSTFAFRSALPAGWSKPYSFIAYGDQGCPDDGWALGGNLTASMVRRELDGHRNGTAPIRLVHHFGDLSYSRGSAYLWDAWLDMVEPFASRLPLMVGIGNHEYDHTTGGIRRDPSGVTTDDGFHPVWGNFRTDSGGECGVPTAKRFLPPKTKQGNYTSNGVFWYAYSFGLVRTIMISSEHDLSKGSPQHMWFQHELKSVNRTTTPFVIVESHRPLYHSKPYWADNAVGIAMRAEFEDLLRKYRVDIFFAGHYHSYLRTCDGLYASKCSNGGPLHITVGTAGAQLDDMNLGLYDNVWTQKYLGVWGYIRATVHNPSLMLLEFVNARNGSVEDSVRLHRRREEER